MIQTYKIFTKHPRFNPTLQLALAFVLLVISVVLSRGNTMTSFEESIFRLVYGLPNFLLPLFFIVTQLGSVYLLWALLLLYLIKRNYHVLLRILMTGTLAYLMSGFMKDVWGRARPDELIAGVINLDYVRGPGFPSGHMALATALAFTIGHYLPRKYYWIVVVWIIGVGLSRLYLGVHAPLDIVGGFAIGWASYAVFRHVRLHDISAPKKGKPSQKTQTKTVKKQLVRKQSSR